MAPYDADDSVKTMTCPSAKVVAYEYDQAGRPKAAGLNSVGATQYLNPTGIAYAPHGPPTTWRLGNGVIETTTYNSRLQPETIQAGTLMTLTFGYGTTANNGNMVSQTINAGGTNFSQSYLYDSVNRLGIATEGGAPAGLDNCGVSATLCRDFSYDAYGNRAATGSQVGPATPNATTAFSTTPYNNRLAASWATYDAAGNLTDFVKSGAYLQWGADYDSENHQRFYYCTHGLTTPCNDANPEAEYVYDGEGNRVQKLTPGVTTTYVYDAFGRLAAEYSTAAPAETPGLYFRTTDHLGSTRLVTTGAGAVYSRHDFFPFGEAIDRSGNGYDDDSAFPQMFTGKERDDESKLDYFLARYYSGGLGRFTSADAPLVDQVAGDPQSWNLYGYVRNRPLSTVDPLGTKCERVDSASIAWKDDGTGGGCALAGIYEAGPITSPDGSYTIFQERDGSATFYGNGIKPSYIELDVLAGGGEAAGVGATAILRPLLRAASRRLGLKVGARIGHGLNQAAISHALADEARVLHAATSGGKLVKAGLVPAGAKNAAISATARQAATSVLSRPIASFVSRIGVAEGEIAVTVWVGRHEGRYLGVVIAEEAAAGFAKGGIVSFKVIQ